MLLLHILFFFLLSVVCENFWEEMSERLKRTPSLTIDQVRTFLSDAKLAKFDAKYAGLPLQVLCKLPLDAFVVDNHLLIADMINLEYALGIAKQAVELGFPSVLQEIHNCQLVMIEQRYATKDKIKCLVDKLQANLIGDSEVKETKTSDQSRNFTSGGTIDSVNESILSGDSTSILSFFVQPPSVYRAKQTLYHAFKVAVPSSNLLVRLIPSCQKKISVLVTFDQLPGRLSRGEVNVSQLVSFINYILGSETVTGNERQTLRLPADSFLQNASNFKPELLALFVLKWESLLRRKRLISSEFVPRYSCPTCLFLLRHISLQYLNFDPQTPFKIPQLQNVTECQHYSSIKKAFLRSKNMHKFFCKLSIFFDSAIESMRNKMIESGQEEFVASMQSRTAQSGQKKFIDSMQNCNGAIFNFILKIKTHFLAVDSVFTEHCPLTLLNSKMRQAKFFDLCNVYSVAMCPDSGFYSLYDAIKYMCNLRDGLFCISQVSAAPFALVMGLNENWRQIENPIVRHNVFKYFARLLTNKTLLNPYTTIARVFRFCFLFSLQRDLDLRLFLRNVITDPNELINLIDMFVSNVVILRQILLQVYSLTIENFANSPLFVAIGKLVGQEEEIKLFVIHIICELADIFGAAGEHLKKHSQPLRREQLKAAIDFITSRKMFEYLGSN